MPGSKSDPVALDPLQTITEVHWRKGDYLAFLTKIGLYQDHNAHFPGSCTEGIPLTGHTSPAYNTGTSYGYEDGSITWNGQATSGVSLWNASTSAWGGTAATITGMPSFPGASATAGPFGDLAQSFSGNVGQPISITEFPLSGAYSIAGAETTVAVPSHPEILFRSGEPTIRIYGASISEAAQCYDIGPSFERRAAYDPAYGLITSIKFPFANILARLADGKAYRPFGCAKVTTGFTGGGPLTAIRMNGPLDANTAGLWILCQRSKADDLS
jgi:hypothetical protein